MVAGSGEATAIRGGTPIAASSGVAIADPPLPKRPPRYPTPAPISAMSTHCTSQWDHLSTLRSKTMFLSYP